MQDVDMDGEVLRYEVTNLTVLKQFRLLGLADNGSPREHLRMKLTMQTYFLALDAI